MSYTAYPSASLREALKVRLFKALEDSSFTLHNLESHNAARKPKLTPTEWDGLR
jgi:hypothetical protein